MTMVSFATVLVAAAAADVVAEAGKRLCARVPFYYFLYWQ